MEFAAAIRHRLLRDAARGRGGRAADVARTTCTYRRSSGCRRSRVILYEGEAEDQLIYVPVEPADPFTEAVRTALEMGAEVVFIEPDLPSSRTCRTLPPIPMRVHAIGYERYVETYRENPIPRDPRDRSARQGHRLALAGRRSNPAYRGCALAEPARRCAGGNGIAARRSGPWHARAARSIL